MGFVHRAVILVNLVLVSLSHLLYKLFRTTSQCDATVGENTVIWCLVWATAYCTHRQYVVFDMVQYVKIRGSASKATRHSVKCFVNNAGIVLKSGQKGNSELSV